MKWIIFSVPPDNHVWTGRPSYNGSVRPKKPEYQHLRITVVPPGQTEVTKTVTQPDRSPLGTLVVTLDGATVDGVSIYADTDEERVERFRQKLIKAPDDHAPMHEDTPWFMVEATDVPGDHPCGYRCEFRNAWVWNGRVEVDMTKARVIKMDKIRVVRNQELVKLDISWMKAVEAGDTAAQSTLATQKQVLRDIPTTFDITTGVTTPELLKAKWPTELPARE